ncbi:MAG: hypothetical protein A2284_17255 [Deltaproteobacteria bacterium RIFOXYA12_FULL_61_11]|nr:MAG: hypothetical protein A2284_17255 [Deltaproteobacteria bacterium RIFOXYA12_FULL_61_11]
MLDGQFRPRLEFDGRDFDADTPLDQYATFRTRLGFTLTDIVPNTIGYLRLSDSRSMGFTDPYNTGRPSPPNRQDTNLGAVEVWLELHDLGFPGSFFKIGRQDNNQGGERLIGPGDWQHTGPRTFDGLRLGYRGEPVKLALWHFYGKNGDRHWYADQDELPQKYKVPGDDEDFTRDHTMTGFDLRLLADTVQLLYYLDRDAKQVQVTGRSATNDAWFRHTAAVYGEYLTKKTWRTEGGFASRGTASYQFGTLGRAEGEADISAWLLLGQVSYALPVPTTPWLGLTLDLTSGDAGTDPAKEHSFNDDYHSKHQYRGHMDLFSDPTSEPISLGMLDLVATVGWQPLKQVSLQLDTHLFRTGEAYASRIDQSSQHVLGVEFDLLSRYVIQKGLEVGVGGCVFLPSEEWQGDRAAFQYTTLNYVF